MRVVRSISQSLKAHPKYSNSGVTASHDFVKIVLNEILKMHRPLHKFSQISV